MQGAAHRTRYRIDKTLLRDDTHVKLEKHSLKTLQPLASFPGRPQVL